MPRMKIADSLGIFALFGYATPENGGASHEVCVEVMKWPTVSGSEHPRSRKARHVSGGLHAHDENCRQSQAHCTFCAPHSRKWRDVSRGLRGNDELPTVSGSEHPRSRKVLDVSGGLHAHAENRRQPQGLCAFWAHRSRKLWDVSGGLRGYDEIAESLRL